MRPATHRVCTLFLLGFVLLNCPAQADEPTPIFVADIQFTGFSQADLEEMEGWPAAFAAEVKSALAGSPGHTPMTLENLQAQLGKERLKATFACEDAACVNRIVENFGCSQTVFTVVRRIGPNKVQVTMDHTAGETVLHSVAPVYAVRDFDSIRGAMQDLGGKLRAAVGGPSGPTEEPAQPVTEKTIGPEGSPTVKTVGPEGPPTAGESGPEAPPTGESGRDAPPTGVTRAHHPWVTSTEWLAARLFMGSHASVGLSSFSLLVSTFTLRWRRFYFTPAQFGLAFPKWESGLIFDVGPSAGVPFHFGRDERHEIRVGAWLPLVIYDGDFGGLGLNFEAVYVYHIHEWFSIHAGVMGGAIFWKLAAMDFMGGGIVGFGI